jgi:hypothetical protein
VDIALAGAGALYHKQFFAACLEEISPLGLVLLVALIRNMFFFLRNAQAIQL